MPEREPILMRDFPLKPGELVVKKFSDAWDVQETKLGKVYAVFARNPEGKTIEMTTREEFEDLIGGIHASVRLKIEDSMWVLIVFFGKNDEPQARIFHTYEIVDMMSKNELQKVEPEEFFANYANIMIH